MVCAGYGRRKCRTILPYKMCNILQFLFRFVIILGTTAYSVDVGQFCARRIAQFLHPYPIIRLCFVGGAGKAAATV